MLENSNPASAWSAKFLSTSADGRRSRGTNFSNVSLGFCNFAVQSWLPCFLFCVFLSHFSDLAFVLLGLNKYHLEHFLVAIQKSESTDDVRWQ